MPNRSKSAEITVQLTAAELQHICEVLGSTIEADMLESANTGDPATIVEEWRKHRGEYVKTAMQGDAALSDPTFYENLRAQHDVEAALIEKLLQFAKRKPAA